MGDTLGCLFEFKNNVGYLTFLKNGVSTSLQLILAFSRLSEFALIIYQREVTVPPLVSTMERFR